MGIVIIGAQYRDRLLGGYWRVQSAEVDKDVRARSSRGDVRRFPWWHFTQVFDLVTG